MVGGSLPPLPNPRGAMTQHPAFPKTARPQRLTDMSLHLHLIAMGLFSPTLKPFPFLAQSIQIPRPSTGKLHQEIVSRNADTASSAGPLPPPTYGTPFMHAHARLSPDVLTLDPS